jgi:hypothetical protein
MATLPNEGQLSQSREAAVRVLWVLLCVLLAGLCALAALVLVKSGVLTSRQLSDAQTKNLWAFLGVVLGAVVTLIGALLTEQHNRRTDALTQESNIREEIVRSEQAAIARQAEERLTLDTVVKVLELVSDPAGNAGRVRVAGALSAMIKLRGGTIAVRILGELWVADAVDSATAVWLIDRVFQDCLSEPGRDDDAEAAAAVLAAYATKLVRDVDGRPDAHWWPATLRGWPGKLSPPAKNDIIVACVRMIFARPPDAWREAGRIPPLDTLHNAAAAADEEYAWGAAKILLRFLDDGVLDALNVLDTLGSSESAQYRESLTSIAGDNEFAPWLAGLLSQAETWLRGAGVSSGSKDRPTEPLSSPRDEVLVLADRAVPPDAETAEQHVIDAMHPEA